MESLSSFYLGCRGAGPPPLLDPIMPHMCFQSRHGDCTACPVHTLPRTSCWVCPLHAQGLWHDRTDTQPLFVPGLPWRAHAVSWLYLLQTPESSAPPCPSLPALPRCPLAWDENRRAVVHTTPPWMNLAVGNGPCPSMSSLSMGPCPVWGPWAGLWGNWYLLDLPKTRVV